MPEPRQLFNEEEVGLLIRKAAEIQDRSSTQPYQAGVSEDELVRIAGEMGVSADSLRQAILDYRTKGQEAKQEGLTTRVERVLDQELDPADFDVVTEDLTLSSTERPTQIGRSISAKVMTGLSQSAINVSSRNGRTRVKVESNPGLGMALAIPPTIIGLAIGLPTLLHGQMPGLFFLVGGLSAASLLIWGGMRSARKNAQTLADKVVQRIQETMHGKGSHLAPPTPVGVEEGDLRQRLNE